MHQAEPVRMQGLAWKGADRIHKSWRQSTFHFQIPPINRVTSQRMAYMRHVNTDLMGSARFE